MQVIEEIATSYGRLMELNSYERDIFYDSSLHSLKLLNVKSSKSHLT